MIPLYSLYSHNFVVVQFQYEGDRLFALFNGREFLKLSAWQSWRSIEQFRRDFIDCYRASSPAEVDKKLADFVGFLNAQKIN